MLASIRYNFAHLFDFAGRDARQTFWFWMLFVFVLNIAASMLISVPATFGAIGSAMDAARSGGDQTAVQAAVMARMSDMIRTMVLVSIGIGLVNVVLVAAALVRRLHDSGKPGVWAVAIGALYVVSLVAAYQQIGAMQSAMAHAAAGGSPGDMMAFQRTTGLRGLLGWAPLILVIVFGVMKSDPGPNKYGDEPVRV